MGKMVGMAEFKAHCTRLLREVQAGGESITVTSRGKEVAVVTAPPKSSKKNPSLFGALKGSVTYTGDLRDPIDPDWEAKWNAKWDERGYAASKAGSNE